MTDARPSEDTRPLEVVFLGGNEAGRQVYEWLCDRDGVFVRALLTTEAQLGMVREDPPDWLVSVGFSHLVPTEVLDAPAEGCLNLHPGLLPDNRGANPNVWTIVEGTPAGVTLHRMDATLDTGPIVAQRKVETSFADTGRDLHERLEDAQVALFTETWPAIERGETTARPQDPAAGTSHVTSEFEALCDLDPHATHTTKELLDTLRALTFPPYENATIEVEGERYHVEVDITSAEE